MHGGAMRARLRYAQLIYDVVLPRLFPLPLNQAGVRAIVTGAASGLGLAAATRLAANGAKVVIADLPSSDGAAQGERERRRERAWETPS